jgi:ethanolaminephosphotransferase
MKKAQELMSSTASNYDVSKLVTGQALAVVALTLSLVAAWMPLTTSLRASLPFVVASLSYGSIMSASSYVEEEHHFWYWITTAWLALLWIKGYVITRRIKE